MSARSSSNKHEDVDSATPVTSDAPKEPTKPKSNDKGKGSGKKDPAKGPSNPSTQKSASSSTKQTPGFADGNSVLTSYGLSVSGRKERILSPFKTEKFFHFVEQSWNQLLRLKPSLAERFSYAEFKHVTALQLFHRIESVKFDTLGIKPSAPTRIPLPRSTRVFQPIWSVLANLGFVDDDELRVVYIPDGILPETNDLTSDKDIENLLSCTLYDWYTSWNNVKKARKDRVKFQQQTGYVEKTISNETPVKVDKVTLMKSIAEQRRFLANAEENLENPRFRLVDGWLYKLPLKEEGEGSSPKTKKTEEYDTDISDADLLKTTKFWSPTKATEELERLYHQARSLKEQIITPRFDPAYSIESYRVSDGTISADPGAYGARLHWDPQLWLEYEQAVEIVTPLALFSLSMPAESSGTYAWVLPVEKREGDDSNVSARLPRASIAPATWILSLLLQSSTLPKERRSTFYVETDRLQNVLGLRQRYIRAAIKDPSAVEQYGTY